MIVETGANGDLGLLQSAEDSTMAFQNGITVLQATPATVQLVRFDFDEQNGMLSGSLVQKKGTKSGMFELGLLQAS